MSNITTASTAAEAAKIYVKEHKEQPFDVTFISELAQKEELELLKA